MMGWLESLTGTIHGSPLGCWEFPEHQGTQDLPKSPTVGELCSQWNQPAKINKFTCLFTCLFLWHIQHIFVSSYICVFMRKPPTVVYISWPLVKLVPCLNFFYVIISEKHVGYIMNSLQTEFILKPRISKIIHVLCTQSFSNISFSDAHFMKMLSKCYLEPYHIHPCIRQSCL